MRQNSNIPNRKAVQSGDLLDYVDGLDPGFYILEIKGANNAVSGLPAAANFIGTFLKTDNWDDYLVVLTLYRLNGETYTKRKKNSWSAEWESFMTSFLPGETWTSVNHYCCTGFISGGTKEIHFMLPLPKDATGRTISVSCSNFTIRGVGGYVVNGVDMASLGNVYVYEQGTQVKIAIAAETAFTATNNTVVCVSGQFKVAFS